MNVSKQQSNQPKSELVKPLTDTDKSPVVSIASQQILAPKRSKPNVMQSSSWMSITGK
jgi:hypothetical protein